MALRAICCRSDRRCATQGTRDLSGPSGLTTPQFVKAVRDRLDSALKGAAAPEMASAAVKVADAYAVDDAAMRELFDSLDADKNGTIDFIEYGPITCIIL